jgi:hypothetical protein
MEARKMCDRCGRILSTIRQYWTLNEPGRFCSELCRLNPIVVGSEVLVDHPKYGNPVWAEVVEIDADSGEVFCTGDDGEDLYANSVDDLEHYPVS